MRYSDRLLAGGALLLLVVGVNCFGWCIELCESPSCYFFPYSVLPPMGWGKSCLCLGLWTSSTSLLSRAAFSTSHFFLSSSAVISASHFSSRLLQSFPPLCCLTWCRCCSRIDVLAVIPRSDDTMFWLLVLASSSLFLLARTGCLRSELPLVGRAKLAFLASVSLAQEFRKLG